MTNTNTTAYTSYNGGRIAKISPNQITNNSIDDVIKLFDDNNVTNHDAMAYLINLLQDAYRDIDGLHRGIKGRQENVNRYALEIKRLKNRLNMYE